MSARLYDSFFAGEVKPALGSQCLVDAHPWKAARHHARRIAATRRRSRARAFSTGYTSMFPFLTRTVISGPDSLFALTDVAALLRDELERVEEHAARQRNGHALVLQACAANLDLAVNTRHLGAVRLHAERERLAGDVACAPGALPWEDDAFRLIVVQHASDVLPSDRLVEELARVLAPAGVLLWFALNPWSPWMAWLHWQARSGLPLPFPVHADFARRRLLKAQLAPVSIDHLGPCWPRQGRSRFLPLNLLRGAYLLTASKQHSVLTPLRPRLVRERASMRPRLAAPSHRSRA